MPDPPLDFPIWDSIILFLLYLVDFVSVTLHGKSLH